MSDLTSELRQVADAAAHQARQLPAADVIRRGDRRRRRSMTQRSLGGLAAMGAAVLAGVMIFTGGPATSQAASGSGHPPGFTAVTDSATSAAGTITLRVSYQVERHGKVKVLAATCSGHSKASVRHPVLLFEFDLRVNGKEVAATGVFVRVKPDRNGDFSGRLPVRHIPVSGKKRPALMLPVGSTLQVALSHATSAKGTTGPYEPNAPLQVGMIFTNGSAR